MAFSELNPTEHTLNSAVVPVGRKTFHIALKENRAGKFLRITEEVGHRRNTVIVPSEGVGELLTAINNVIEGQTL